MKRRQVRSRQVGFTMIEMLIVLAVAGIATAFIVGYFSNATRKNNVNEEVKNLAEIVTNIRAKYTSQQTFAGLTLGNLVNLQVFPEERVTGAATAANAFGGAWAVALNPPANDAVTLTGGQYPRAICADMVAKAAPTFNAISVNGTAVKAAGGALDINATGTNCNLDQNTIAWTFLKN